MKRVLLLKAVKQSEEEDIYMQTLTKENYDVSLVSPLSFKFTNIQQLTASLQQPSQYSGIIFSSPRTVEATQKCLPELGENGLQGWKPLPAYCVGQATANFVRDQLGLTTVGEQSGNAHNLVQIILEGTKAGSKPLLFPCGTLRRETIPESLQKAGIDFQAHVVYETIAHPDLEHSINQYFDKGMPEFIVFFSPSGVRFSKEFLAKYELEKIQYFILKSFLALCAEFMGGMVTNRELTAIGPTTKAAMEQCGYTVACTAEKPTPDALITVLHIL